MHVKEEVEALWYLQQSSFRIEAAIIGLGRVPQIRDTVKTLQKCGETFVGCYLEDELIGAVSYKMEGNKAVICRMMVHADHFRQGVASRLLSHVLDHVPAELFVVSASARNVPAIRLYEKFQFKPHREITPIPGVTLIVFHKSGNSGQVNEGR